MRWMPSSEMGARARRSLRLSPRGVGRGGTCARGQGGSGEAELAPEAKGGRARRNPRPSPRDLGCLPYLLFAIFIRLIWVSLFMVPNTHKCDLLIYHASILYVLNLVHHLVMFYILVLI